MERKTIFERLSEEVNYYDEFTRIITLFKSSYNKFQYYVDDNFWSWKYRDSCTSSSDMLSRFGFDLDDYYRYTYIDGDKFLTFCEIMINFTIIANFGAKSSYRDIAVKIGSAIADNIDVVLNKLGYKVFYYSYKKHAIVVQQNPVAFEAAEIIDEQYSVRLLEYNHYLLKGNLEEKRSILNNLASWFEANRKHLNSNELERCCDDIGFLLNNLNIRHNNSEGKKKNKILESLSKTELENWYDKTYTLLLYAVISSQNIEIMKEIKELKAMLN